MSWCQIKVSMIQIPTKELHIKYKKLLIPAVQVVELCFGFPNWSKASCIVLCAVSIAIPGK